MSRAEIYKAIGRERTRQHRKWAKSHAWGWGDCSSLKVEQITKSAVLSEECGEVTRAVLEKNNEQLKAELIQVAAVAVAWLESL